MELVELGSLSSPRLVLGKPRRGDDGELWWVPVTLELDGLKAEKTVNAHYATCFDELIGYLEDLAANWSGWDGTKGYESLEHDLVLKARHDGYGHVAIQVTLSKMDGSADEWECTGRVTTEPGAQMAEVAESARQLLARFP